MPWTPLTQTGGVGPRRTAVMIDSARRATPIWSWRWPVAPAGPGRGLPAARGAVYGLARRILRSDPPAEEITQEVFLDLWNHPEKFDAQRGTLRSCLLARTHGKAVDFVRSESPSPARGADLRQTATAGYDIEHEVWDMAVADQVQAASAPCPTSCVNRSSWPIRRSHLPGGGQDPAARRVP